MRKITFFMFLCTLVLCISGCAKNDTEQGLKVNETSTEQSLREDREYADPLLGYDIIFPSGWESGENFEMVTLFLDAESVKAEEILMVNSNDFDGDNEPEIFVFTGEMTDEELGIYEGSLWLITKEGYEKVGLDENNGWIYLSGTLDFGEKAYMYMDEYYSTGALSHVFTVENKKAKATLFSKLGLIGAVNVNDFSINVSSYDYFASENDDGTLDYTGRTEKPYYFYFDKDKKEVCEYAAAKVYDEDVAFMLGDSFLDMVSEYDIYPTDYMYRANGILTINYEKFEEEGVEYGNINYDHINGEFVGADNFNSEAPFLESNFGGKYKRYICPELAVFPTGNDAYFIREDDKDTLVTMGLYVDYLENMDLYDYEEVSFDEEENFMYDTRVAFVAYKTFKDFKAYSMEPYASGDTMVNAKDEIYRRSEISQNKPLVIDFAFPGDFSANGFSFTDETGKERIYMITISGYDGSLVIEEV